MRTRRRQHVDLNPVVPRPRRLSRDVPSPASGGFLPAGPIAARTAPRCDAGSAPSRWGSCRSKMRCGHSAAVGALGKCGHTSLFRCMVVRRRSGSPPRRNAAPCQDHLEDDAHRPLKHYWTGLRRRAERAQSQQQSLGEQGMQHGVRRQLKNDELGDDRSSVQRL